MNKLMRVVIAITLICVSIVSCKSKKEAVKTVQPKTEILPTANATLLKAVKANENNVDFYNARGSANYRDDDQHYDLDLDITMERGLYTYINVTALFGVPVARLWFTRDSICILDVLNRKCILTDYAYLRSKTNVPMNFDQVQNLLAGNSVFLPTEKQMIADTVLDKILITSNLLSGQLQTTYYNSMNFKVSRLSVADKSMGRDLRIEYTECYTHGNNCLPKDFNINIRAEKNMECHLNLDYFAFDKKKEIKFAIPKSYKIVRI